MDPVTTLHRPAHGAPIAGVCAAVADRTGIDPLIIRVAAVLLAVSSGIGLVLYLAGWLLIPREDHEQGILLETFPGLAGAPRWVLVSVLAVALVLVSVTANRLTSTSMFPALIIGLVYYFGVHRPRRRRELRDARPDPPPAPGQRIAGTMPPPRPFGTSEQGPAGRSPADTEAGTPTVIRPAAGPPQGPGAPDVRSGPYTAAPWPPPPDPAVHSYLSHADPIGLYAPPPPGPRRTRLPDPQRLAKRTLGLVTLTALGLVWTALALAATVGQPFPLDVWAAAALVVVGAALVIGAWVGRPRGLVGVALVLALVATASAYRPEHAIPQPVMAPETVTYGVATALPSADAWDIGAPVVDLRDLAPQHDVTYEVHMNAGALTILVPESARVVVKGRVAMGTLTVGDWSADAPPAQSVTRVVSDGDPGAPTVTIDASVEVGELVVRPV